MKAKNTSSYLEVRYREENEPFTTTHKSGQCLSIYPSSSLEDLCVLDSNMAQKLFWTRFGVVQKAIINKFCFKFILLNSDGYSMMSSFDFFPKVNYSQLYIHVYSPMELSGNSINNIGFIAFQ